MWPEQDMSLRDVEKKYEANGENEELLRIHRSILEDCDLEWFTTLRPKFFDIPYPGPKEYLSKFPEDKDIILADHNFCFFLPIWREYLTDLVIVDVPLEETDAILKQWVPGETRERREAVVRNYSESLEGDIGLVGKVWYIKNDSLKAEHPVLELTTS